MFLLQKLSSSAFAKYSDATSSPTFLVVSHGLWIHAFLGCLLKKGDDENVEAKKSFCFEMKSDFDVDGRFHVANTARSYFSVRLDSQGEIQNIICHDFNQHQHLSRL